MNKPYAQIHMNSVLKGLKPNNLIQLFDSISPEIVQQTGLSERTVKAMNKRMIQKSFCAMGRGLALPNVKVTSLKEPFTLLCLTDKPVACDTPDQAPIDMMCIVLSPTSDGPLHLQRLSRISRLFKNQILCAKIREAKDPDVIRALLSSPDGLLEAA